MAQSLRASPHLHCSYIFVTPGANIWSVPAKAIVAYEPLAMHEDGFNILFAAGKNSPPSLE